MTVSTMTRKVGAQPAPTKRIEVVTATQPARTPPTTGGITRIASAQMPDFIYYDVDDTLILWSDPLDEGPHPWMGKTDEWHWNDGLLILMEELYGAFPNIMYTIWSGGGRSYAKEFRDRSGFIGFQYMAKDLTWFKTTGGLWVDDQAVSIRESVSLTADNLILTPEEFEDWAAYVLRSNRVR